MQRRADAVEKIVQEIAAQIGRATNDDTPFVEADLLHLVGRDQEELASKSTSAHLEEVRLVDTRDEAKSLDEAHRAGRPLDSEALTTCKRVASLDWRCVRVTLGGRRSRAWKALHNDGP